MLAILIEQAKNDDQIGWVFSHLMDVGLSILQYANGTIMFMEHELGQTRNLQEGLDFNFWVNVMS